MTRLEKLLHDMDEAQREMADMDAFFDPIPFLKAYLKERDAASVRMSSTSPAISFLLHGVLDQAEAFDNEEVQS